MTFTSSVIYLGQNSLVTDRCCITRIRLAVRRILLLPFLTRKKRKRCSITLQLPGTERQGKPMLGRLGDKKEDIAAGRRDGDETRRTRPGNLPTTAKKEAASWRQTAPRRDSPKSPWRWRHPANAPDTIEGKRGHFRWVPILNWGGGGGKGEVKTAREQGRAQ
ncbi:hypothetical protein NDU88_003789 [Pleurodeles waltl]|uniref:Uncharacterized protein n=1 Tax=Pleurodeles waltl TaxID=8319 RepID=A0AAV7RE46_PLEWA|nr:hypothetical protein NDU88_003789 [Pleurodeles waltl]